MPGNILKQLTYQVIATNKFSIRLDESTNIQNNAQLMICMRFRSFDGFCEEFLFCESYLTTATDLDIFQKLDDFFRKIIQF